MLQPEQFCRMFVQPCKRRSEIFPEIFYSFSRFNKLKNNKGVVSRFMRTYYFRYSDGMHSMQQRQPPGFSLKHFRMSLCIIPFQKKNSGSGLKLHGMINAPSTERIGA